MKINGEKVKRLRELNGWSQAQFAKRVGINEATVNRVERGRATPHPQNMRKIADALNVKIADLAREESNDE